MLLDGENPLVKAFAKHLEHILRYVRGVAMGEHFHDRTQGLTSQEAFEFRCLEVLLSAATAQFEQRLNVVEPLVQLVVSSIETYVRSLFSLSFPGAVACSLIRWCRTSQIDVALTRIMPMRVRLRPVLSTDLVRTAELEFVPHGREGAPLGTRRRYSTAAGWMRGGGADTLRVAVLKSDEDLSGMYLTHRKVTGLPRAMAQHTEAEMLLETYSKKAEEVHNEIAELLEHISATEHLIQLALSATRNNLLYLSIRIAMLTVPLVWCRCGRGAAGHGSPTASRHSRAPSRWSARPCCWRRQWSSRCCSGGTSARSAPPRPRPWRRLQRLLRPRQLARVPPRALRHRLQGLPGTAARCSGARRARRGGPPPLRRLRPRRQWRARRLRPPAQPPGMPAPPQCLCRGTQVPRPPGLITHSLPTPEELNR